MTVQRTHGACGALQIPIHNPLRFGRRAHDGRALSDALAALD
ncbi:hypothetical protein AB0N23_00860 [Streptomyces sp. NPDC052644]